MDNSAVSTETLHLIAGLMTMLIGVVALAMPLYRNYKEPVGSEVNHLKFKTVLIGIMTIVLGGLVAANKIEQIVGYARSFGATLFGGGGA